jgi:hypothetical protein
LYVWMINWSYIYTWMINLYVWMTNQSYICTWMTNLYVWMTNFRKLEWNYGLFEFDVSNWSCMDCFKLKLKCIWSVWIWYVGDVVCLDSYAFDEVELWIYGFGKSSCIELWIYGSSSVGLNNLCRLEAQSTEICQ